MESVKIYPETWNESLWINDLRQAFERDENAKKLVIKLKCLDGRELDFSCPVSPWREDQQRKLILDYLTARLFNILSIYSGRKLELFLDEKASALRALAEESLARFENVPGLKKAVNIANRLCRATTLADFSTEIKPQSGYIPAETPEKPSGSSLDSRLEHALAAASGGIFCGIDVGGTDIKLALSVDGRLAAVKEFDWNPAEGKTAEAITEPVIMLAGLMQASAVGYMHPENEGLNRVINMALEKDASAGENKAAIAAAAAEGLPKFNGIGLSYPDIVFNDHILGGETPKTKGIRENPDVDYEAELSKISAMTEQLKTLCVPGAAVRAINDGTMAAFGAALETFAGGGSVGGSVMAHSLGTDLGTGWIDAGGEIPQIPLECYDLLVDLGSEKAKMFPPEDLRSVKNENSSLAGARRYLGQAAVYRLVSQEKDALLSGFAEECGGIYKIISEPVDMRKPCLESIMEKAESGDAAAEKAFRQVGVNLGQLTLELEYLLHTGTRSRWLFGRFVKNQCCFGLIKDGFYSVIPEMELRAADENMAYTPLMKQLSKCSGLAVAQFAQAVSAIYFSRI